MPDRRRRALPFRKNPIVRLRRYMATELQSLVYRGRVGELVLSLTLRWGRDHDLLRAIFSRTLLSIYFGVLHI